MKRIFLIITAFFFATSLTLAEDQTTPPETKKPMQLADHPGNPNAGKNWVNGHPHGWTQGQKKGWVNGHPPGWDKGKKKGWYKNKHSVPTPVVPVPVPHS